MHAGISNGNGTRFRLFPRPPFLHPGWPPDVVSISTPPYQMGPGLSDDRLYVIDPIGKRRPYGVNVGLYGAPYIDLPPWRGPIRRPAQPGPDGHFDHIPLDAPEFAQVHVFGAARFVLDIWERYLGGPIQWHFSRDFRRLEVILLPSLNNAQVGYGFMQVGAHHGDDGTLTPYALNFDVIAHELGHLIIYATIGVPSRATDEGEYYGFQESASDTTALIAASHFESLIESLLEDTRGNLYTFNELNRFAELSATRQIRLASNSVKLSEFATGWRDEHDLSQPLTGAVFDILVDIFQENLVERGLIERYVADLSDSVRDHPEYQAAIQKAFDAAYPGQEEGFRGAFVAARDYLGSALAETWKRMSADFFHYAGFAKLLLGVDQELTGGRCRAEMIESFAWREIGTVTVGPRLAKMPSHSQSSRTIVPEHVDCLPRMCYRERVLVAQGYDDGSSY